MAMRSLLPLGLALTVVLAGAAPAQVSPAAQRGHTFARANCANCHAVDKFGESPLPLAPPFRAMRFAPENLEAALMRGIRDGHPNMPAFQLDPGQVDDLVAYLKTLQP